MILRPAEKGDAQALADVHRASRKGSMPWLPDLHTPAEDLWFFEHLVIPDQDVIVSEIDGQVAGFIACSDQWLHHLYVNPAFWGKGVGSALLKSVQDRYPALQLWVFQRNTAAQAFYERHGFVEEERTDGSANEEKLPDIKMRWIQG